MRPFARFSPHSQLHTLGRFLPFLWPRGRVDLRLRVVVAIIMLVAAKVTNVLVPMALREAVDALSVPQSELLVIPLALLLAYGAARVLALGFGEVRDAIFVKVAQHAIRQVGLRTFRHLHALSLRFHLERRTGGLTRAIDRGAKGIEFLLFFAVFNVLPTILEIGLVCGILWVLFDWRFAAITLVTIVGYVCVTFSITEWRIRLRRRMNEADNDANTKAVDSLLNYETVKYFGNEGHEARRYDSALQTYEHAAIRSRVSMSLLNVVQALVVAVGMTAMLVLTANGMLGRSPKNASYC